MTATRNRMNDKKHKIIDGDGHVVEDHPAIVAHMSKDLSSATVPERKTRSPNSAALQFHSRGLMR